MNRLSVLLAVWWRCMLVLVLVPAAVALGSLLVRGCDAA